MLELTIPSEELWDEKKQEFIYTVGQSLRLEHSLVSISKWESKHLKPFLTRQEKTYEETIDYVRCMTVSDNTDENVYYRLTKANFEQVEKYIDNPMTATTFSNISRAGRNSEQITAELVYYWMIALNIPFECQYWHLNRLLTLIQVCNIKNQPPKKHSKRAIMSRNSAINAARRNKLNTLG